MHKKGSKTDVNNYRSISLLPVMSKILERIFYKRLYSFLSQADFFHQYQFGFRKNHSTSNALTVVLENALTIMIENVTKALKNNNNIHWVFSWICQWLFTRLMITSYFTNCITMELGDYPINDLKVV